MPLEERIFSNFKEAVETFIRMGFEFTSSNTLMCNNLKVTVDNFNSVCRCMVEEIERCKQVQNNHLNHVVAECVRSENTQKPDMHI